MSSAGVIPIDRRRRATWSLIEVAQPGQSPQPLGILLADEETGALKLRFRDTASFAALGEQDGDILEALAEDLREKARETGAAGVIDSLEDTLSHFLRIADRAAISFTGSAQRMADRLFDEHVEPVKPYVTHIPIYTLRAAATKFGEGMESEEEGWMRLPSHRRIARDLFAAHVVGRSMEPVIPDGSLCLFRGNTAGSRAGKLLLIEKSGETDFAARYTVKRYARKGNLAESAERTEAIRLEPLNPEFAAFDLETGSFRVIGEFLEVLES